MADCDNNQNPPEIEEQFPEGSVPDVRLNSVSALCSYGMRPHVMTGLLRQLLISHLSDPDNIEEPRLRKHAKDVGAWKSSDIGLNGSGFLVESITRWQPNIADKRPAVYIKRNSWKWMKLGIGNRATTDIATGTQNYTGAWEGSHTLFCLAPNGIETELLTTEVVKFLLRFSPLILDQMSLLRFQIEEVGGIGEVQEVIQGYAVPVTVAYVAEESWSLQPYAPRLKRIVFRASDLTSY